MSHFLCVPAIRRFQSIPLDSNDHRRRNRTKHVVLALSVCKLNTWKSDALIFSLQTLAVSHHPPTRPCHRTRRPRRMSTRRTRKRKREDSSEIVGESGAAIRKVNGEPAAPTGSTPTRPSGEDVFSDALQDKDQAIWESFREEYIECMCHCLPMRDVMF